MAVSPPTSRAHLEIAEASEKVAGLWHRTQESRRRSSPAPASSRARATRFFNLLQGLQVLDHVVLFPRGQPEAERRIVVLDDVEQRREAAVMIEAALRVREQ